VNERRGGGTGIPGILQALALALALGMTSGMAFSAGGWLVSGVLLLGTAILACVSAGHPAPLAVGAIAAIIVVFNIGIGIGLMPRIFVEKSAAAG
jgi:hypothetical protein